MSWIYLPVVFLFGLIMPWQFTVTAMLVFLTGYLACYRWKWVKPQLAQAYCYGFTATGAALQAMIQFDLAKQTAASLIAPVIVLFVTRAVFIFLEKRYGLKPTPPADVNAGVIVPKYIEVNSTSYQGHSAWSGDTEGRAARPNAKGQYMQYQFFCTGEIAMGGPTYGDVIFSNRCAVSGVGPSLVLSDDGRYAILTHPSRDKWCMSILDLEKKCIYRPNVADAPWEIHAIENGMIIGHHSPLTNSKLSGIRLEDIIQYGECHVMIEDQGWWLEDAPNRKPLPIYEQHLWD